MWEYFTLKRAEVKRMLRGKGKKGYKVSGNRNLPLQRFWSKSEEMWIWDVAPKSRGRVISQQGMTAGKSSKKDTGKKKSHQNGLSRKYVKLVRKRRKTKLDAWASCRKF